MTETANKNKMRVLIVNRYMSIYGGAENVVKELAYHLNNLGIENIVITLNISEEVKRICNNINIVTPNKFFPYKFRSVNLFSSIGILKEIFYLRKLVSQYVDKFDLINVHNFPAIWAIYGINKPVVWMCNEPPDFYNNPRPSILIKFLRNIGIIIDKFIVNRVADAIIVADKINSARVKKRYHCEPIIIPYGIDQQILSNEKNVETEIKKRYNLSDKDFVLIQVGMISPQKNQIEALKALKALMELGVSAKLILIGKEVPSYKRILERFIKESNLTNYVIFTGHLPKYKVAEIYAIAHLCLFPVKEQGGWLAPFEALSFGKPVIVSHTMGAADMLKKHNFALITDNFENATREVYQNYEFYLSKAREGQNWVKENLNWEKFSKNMVEVFEKILRERKTSQ